MMFRIIIRRYGIATIAIGITLLAAVLALGITWSIHSFFRIGSLKDGLIIAVAAALVIAPLLSIPMLRVLYQLDETEQHLQALSYTDELTQTYNRRYFMQYLNREFRRARRSGKGFSIAILDLDNFKIINDRWGHLVGDQVLCKMTQILREHIRESDILARYGGDEFIFLFPETNQQEFQIWAGRIYDTFAATLISLNELEIQPSFSIGVAIFDPKVHTVDELLKQADDSLYQAKRLGGNQVMIHQDPEVY